MGLAVRRDILMVATCFPVQKSLGWLLVYYPFEPR